MVRIATTDDLEAIVEIYNLAIAARFQTCFTEPFTVDTRLSWFQEHKPAIYPIFVYVHVGKVVGYLNVSPYRQGRNALRFAVEVSYFIHPDFHRMGMGTSLLESALICCRESGYKTVLAILLETNTGSIKLLEKFGFANWGYLPQIADFDGITCSQLYYGLKL